MKGKCSMTSCAQSISFLCELFCKWLLKAHHIGLLSDKIHLGKKSIRAPKYPPQERPRVSGTVFPVFMINVTASDGAILLDYHQCSTCSIGGDYGGIARIDHNEFINLHMYSMIFYSVYGRRRYER